ncbi:S-layer homology domain-containing protein [Paenibacillus gansuensis]|uniref:S-layer homology domain-containing protein n=1 Tax=Paenibacillus gansuensis TaxID=306542 RepID=A0ABW5PB25_9BACL
MEKKSRFKVLTVSALALALAVGGPAAAFAKDDHGKGKGKGHDDHKPGVQAKSNVTIQFKDIDEKQLQWALQYIMGLASKDVFSGDGKGNFLPQKKVTRAEAITAAVRLMGLKDKAESAEEKATKLNFTDAKKIEEKFPWAVGYIAVAVENDLFSETETAVQPERPADRLWATTLLVKALKLDGEAKAKMNTKLDFKDADKIPAGSVGYVAVALEKKLIAGYDDRTFRPNQPVTRAELAALLGRTDEQLPDKEDKTAVTGTVTGISNNIVTIKKKDGTSTALIVDPNAFIFRNNVRVGVNALVAGDLVLARSFNNVVVYMEVRKEAEPAPVKVPFVDVGKISYTTMNAELRLSTITLIKNVNGADQIVTYNVASNVVIKGDVSKLQKDQVVIVKGENQVVQTIEIQ